MRRVVAEAKAVLGGLILFMLAGAAGAAVPPPITPLRVDGPAASVILEPFGEAWYSMEIQQWTQAMIGALGISVWGVSVELYGPESREAPMLTQTAIQNAPLRIVRDLYPGTYYLRVRSVIPNEYGSASLWVRTLDASQPAIMGLSIDNGAEMTAQRRVTLRIDAINATEMMISESLYFTGAAWRPFQPVTTFDLSAGEGLKWVYVKVSRETSHTLASLYDAIQLATPRTLPENGAYIRSTLEQWWGDADWYTFQAREEANYDITTLRYDDQGNQVDFFNGHLSLFGPDDPRRLVAEKDEWERSANPRILSHLKPGKYLVKMRGQDSRTTGTYSIRLASTKAPIITGYATLPAKGKYFNYSPYPNQSRYITFDRAINLNFTLTGSFTEWRASERPDFKGDAWRPFTTGTLPLKWNLTRTEGEKSLYFQVRDGKTRLASKVQRDRFIYLEPRPLTVERESRGEIGKRWRSNLFVVDVARAGDYLLEIEPRDCDESMWLKTFGGTVAALSPSETGGFYTYYWGNDTFSDTRCGRVGVNDLEPGRYYVFVGGGDTPYRAGEWYRGPYDVKLTRYTGSGPLATNLRLEYGYPSTLQRRIAVDCDVLGNAPTHYMISTNSSFRGAAWKDYDADFPGARFTLPAGNGKKTVHLKVKDAAGHESPVIGKSIQLTEPLPLQVGAAALNIDHDPGFSDRFTVDVRQAGRYILQLAPASRDAIRRLPELGSISPIWNEGQVVSNTLLSNENHYRTYRLDLAAGKYNILVRRPDSDPLLLNYKGHYMIRIYEDSAGH